MEIYQLDTSGGDDFSFVEVLPEIHNDFPRGENDNI